MSGSEPDGGARPRPPAAGSRRAPVAGVAVGAALVALALGGHGLLVPAGPATPLIRAGGALVALAAVGVLLRRDGPAQGSRTLALVAVAGALTGLATLPASPVTLDGSLPDPAPAPAPGDDQRTVLLDPARPPDGPGATLAVPPGAAVALADGSVVAQRPDGSTTVLGPADPGTVVESADGTQVVVVDGALLEVPAPVPTEDGEAGADPLDDGVEAVLALLLGTFALLAFAPPLLRVAGRVVEPAPALDEPRAPRPPTRTVEAGLADVLRAMLADPDPRTAVIGAYARLLVALEDAGVPRRPEEGPHEHLWRTLGPLGVRRGPVHRLAELFVRARFTPRPITDEHRRDAIGALADAVADLRLQAADVDALVGGRA